MSINSLEKDLIMYLYQNPDCVDQARELLSPHYFLDDRARIVYEAMIDLTDNELGASSSLLYDKCKKRMPEMTWEAYILKLADPTVVNLQYICKRIRNQWSMKKYHDMQDELAQVLDSETKADNVTRLVEDRLDEIALEVDSEKESGEISDTMQAMLEQFDYRSKVEGLIGLDTGFDRLNLFTHGMMRGKMTVIAGRPSMGRQICPIR